MLRFSQASANFGADIDQLGKQRELQGPAQERHAGGAAGALLEADDALDGLHVAKAPEEEVLLHVDQLLAHVVLGPVSLRILIYFLEHRSYPGVALVGLRPV